ncbi:MAG: hypothetical protein BWZ03_00833 [bacterium ADurb.BinA186]|nr:MAG: hypothetical protein BWZ03_00833 [bacterium ADurb.BinA186]
MTARKIGHIIKGAFEINYTYGLNIKMYIIPDIFFYPTLVGIAGRMYI